jgi:pyrimidine-nucleoside phosphorylase
VGFIGQTDEICPADKRIYALRDVTATVESIPLICASILSKKLAEGAQGLVLDVKFGNGAFFKTAVEAENLAHALLDVYKGFNKKGVALLTNMNQPLGFTAGNSLEVLECLDILQNRTRPNTLGVDLYQDTRELSLELSAQMLFLSEQFGDLASCRKKAEQILVSGRAYEKFVQICNAQGGDLGKIGRAPFQLDILAKQSGFVSKIETEKLGYLNIHLGAGRRQITDVVDPTSGVEFLFKLGHAAKKGQTLMRLHGASLELLKTWAPEFQKAFVISDTAPVGESLVFKVVV